MATRKRKSTRKSSAASESSLTQALKDQLRSRDLKERFAAIEELARLGLVEELLDVLHSESWYTREKAAEALIQLGEQVEEKTVPFLEEGYWYTRAMALRILGKVGKPERLPLLVRHLSERNQAVRREAAMAVVAMLERFPELRAELSSTDRQTVERILTEHKEVEALQSLRNTG